MRGRHRYDMADILVTTTTTRVYQCGSIPVMWYFAYLSVVRTSLLPGRHGYREVDAGGLPQTFHMVLSLLNLSCRLKRPRAV
jgi:hypothetical protein